MTGLYPGIVRAALNMARCNGGINRYRSEKDCLRSLELLLAEASVALDLRAISEWLAALSEEDLLTVVDGDETEAAELVKSAPEGTQMFLDEIFNKVV